MGVTIQLAPLIEQVSGVEKIPISDNSGLPKAVTTEQLKTYIDVPNETTVEDWGFTKNQGTIGAVDLGTDVDEPDLYYITNELFANVEEKISDLDSNINSIGYNTFYDCQNLYIEDLSLPNLTTLGNYAFAGCKIQKITNLGLITSIPDWAFYKNTELKMVDMSEHITSIGSRAFMDCKSLQYMILRTSTPPTLGGWAIDDTISTPIYVPDASVDAYKAADGWGSYASRIKPLSEYVA